MALSPTGRRWVLSRWTTQDPMAAVQYAFSPYGYCNGNPIIVVDRDGNIGETVWDVASLVTGVKSFVSNVKQGKVGAAIVDGVGIVADAAAVATPLVPGGVGAGIKAVRAGGKAVDAVKGVERASDAAKAANKAGDATGAIGKTKTYQTYTKTNKETGQVYVGRTSGYGTPEQNVKRRDQNHHMNKKGYGPAELDKSSSNPDAIRGQEQYLMDKKGGARSDGGTSGNTIRGVARNNPKASIYEKARVSEFGE